MTDTLTIRNLTQNYPFKRRKKQFSEKVMIIVDDQNIEMFEDIIQDLSYKKKIVYILTNSFTIRDNYHYQSRIYPLGANIKSLLRHDIVDEVLCCFSTLPFEYVKNLSSACNEFGVSLLIQPHDQYQQLSFTESKFVGDFLFYAILTSPLKRAGYHLKTSSEITFAAITLALFSPFLLLVAMMIKLTSRGPVIFKQQRVGLRGRRFYIYKFRTMIVDAEALKEKLMHYNETDGPAFKIRNDPRITLMGGLLRKTGLDEIPQLFNVLKGEMSLIGPRPMLPEEVSAQQEWQLKRMCIKPGITCTWQIHPNRNKVPFDKWMQLDREYVENWSIWTDMKIFIYTVRSMFIPSGL